jgi:hypothetical protein
MAPKLLNSYAMMNAAEKEGARKTLMGNSGKGHFVTLQYLFETLRGRQRLIFSAEAFKLNLVRQS